MNTFLRFNVKYSVLQIAGQIKFDIIGKNIGTIIPDEIIIPCLHIIHEALNDFDIFAEKYYECVTGTDHSFNRGCYYEINVPENDSYYLSIYFQKRKITYFTVTKGHFFNQ